LREQLQPLYEKLYGPEDIRSFGNLLLQAQLLEQLDKTEEAISIRERIQQVAEREFPEKVAVNAYYLGNNYEVLGRLELALAAFTKLVLADEKKYGSNHLEVATDLGRQAWVLESLQRQSEALPLYIRALTIREKELGSDHLSIANALNNLGTLYQSMGQYSQAEPLLVRALESREKQLGPNHPDTGVSLNNLAELYRSMRQYARAEPLYLRAMAIFEKHHGSDHPSTATCLNNLAVLYKSMGQYALAEPLYMRALAISEKANGPEHPTTGIRLHSLAELYRLMGQYARAEPLFVRALMISEVTEGSNHPSTAASLNGLALLYHSMGQYARAEPLMVRALAILEMSKTPDYPSIALILDSLAINYREMSQYSRAFALQELALAIREKQLGPEHPDTAQSLNNLAVLYQIQGQYAQAEPLFTRALVISEKAEGPEHPSTAISLNNLAEIYRNMGQYARAEPLYRRALAIKEKVNGPDDPSTGNSLHNLAMYLGIQHKPSLAMPLMVRASTIAERNIATTFLILSEQQKLQFVKEHEFEVHGMISLIHRQLSTNPEAIRSALDLVLSRKGIVFDAQARQQDAIARSLDPETKKLWDALSNQRSELAKLMQNKPEKMSGEDYQKRIASYQSEIGKLEGQLASKSALIAQDLKQRKITTKEVAQTLGKDGALVEYTKIQDYDWEHGKWSDTWRYLAFVLHGDGKIQMVDLGEAGALETTVQAALKPIGIVGTGNDQQQDATRILHQALWQPIAAAVGEASKIVFSPDGLLNLVPFAAMQDADGHYLIENRQVSYVTSGRDLTKGDLGIKPETELYLAANPTFDLVAQANPAAASEEPTRGAVRSVSFGMHFSPLPGTAKEAEQIPNYLKGKHTVLTGKDATEDSVLNTRRPRVMHLSTHGFFLADQAAITQGTRGASQIESDQPQAHNSANASALPQGYENPLVRSGLAFAGANHAGDAKGGRDGLLTALEVSGMDLHGTDLVTLSACETGRGEVKSGEGVFGLRRAFALAGTAHLMMSLWPVSDDVTAQQMQSFYQLYGKKTNPAAALRQAQLATIAELRSKRGQAEPALWAPFIVQGN
jgi:CHAT domain-containing protein/Tfp pilus assembly protein PilF